MAARVLWLIGPVLLAGLGHVAVLKVNVLRWLAVPIDGGACWRGDPLLGANKTWRGPVVMTVGTGIVTALQGRLSPRPARFRAGSNWRAGALIGLAYALAELPNSFMKRRLGIGPGERSRRLGTVQYLVDQTDSVAGCLVAARLMYRLSRREICAAFVLGTAAHVAVDLLMHALKLKRAT